jgi:hypothetical protein
MPADSPALDSSAKFQEMLRLLQSFVISEASGEPHHPARGRASSVLGNPLKSADILNS